MSLSEHTPTPWRRGLYGGVYPIDGGPMIVSGQTKSGFLPRHVENEAFIVKAANSHDALVAALEAAQSHLITLGGNPHPHNPDADQIQVAVLMVVRDALSQAKSEGDVS